jgi:hypothetical protein
MAMDQLDMCAQQEDTGFMTTKRVPMNISFPSEEEKQAAIKKAAQRKRSVSEQVQLHFRKLPLLQDD